MKELLKPCIWNSEFDNTLVSKDITSKNGGDINNCDFLNIEGYNLSNAEVLGNSENQCNSSSI